MHPRHDTATRVYKNSFTRSDFLPLSPSAPYSVFPEKWEADSLAARKLLRHFGHVMRQSRASLDMGQRQRDNAYLPNNS